MFYRDKITQALDAKRAELSALDSEQLLRLQELFSARNALAGATAAEICEQLAPEAAPGALPTEEFDRQPDLHILFPESWSNVAAMRHWAAEMLADVAVCAVDGSQLPATKDFPLPIAAVQVAWYMNSHKPDGDYEKDARVEVLTPSDLGADDSDANMWIALRRYEMEVAQINDFMQRQSERGSRAVALFDGSLTVSFAGPHPEVRDRYRAAAVSMLHTSEECKVPLIAYIDRSRARDFTRMLCYLHGISLAGVALISDAALLEHQSADGTFWRLPSFLCQRQDVVHEGNYTDTETGKSYSNEICFTYLKINSGPPSRLEFPRWLLQDGLLDRVIDWVRAEAIAGGGYPYAIQAADGAAVIDFRDRQRYQRALEEFGQRNGIRTMQASAKQASKERRRA